MGLPPPQFNTPLTPSQVNSELPFYPIYGVTPDDKWTPVSITENGQLSIGSVTISGPVTISDVVIKGVDPDNSFVSEDVDVFNLGSGNGWSLRTTLFDTGNNHLAINSDGSINVSSASPSISNVTSVAQSAINQEFLALNINRRGVTIYNTSSDNLYLKLGAIASSTSFTVIIMSQGYYEVPFNYLGEIDGIWASAGSGTALVTELS
jgi:hypothetical protein